MLSVTVMERGSDCEQFECTEADHNVRADTRHRVQGPEGTGSTPSPPSGVPRVFLKGVVVVVVVVGGGFQRGREGTGPPPPPQETLSC